MAKAKIPSKLYVTARGQGDNRLPLGFLHGHGDGSTYESKRKTQEKWAYNNYNHIRNFELKLEFGEYWVFGTTYNWKTRVDDPVRQLVAFPPQIWDNLPLDGFKIVKTVSRSSTSNKLWQIEDPRGIEFQISTASMEELVSNTTIQKGIIMDKCIWKSNNDLIVAE